MARGVALPLVVLVAASLATACLTTERPAVQDTNRLAAGAVSLPTTGEWQNGDEHLTFTVTARDSVTEIAELMTFGTDGTARRTLQLDARGALRAFRELRSQTAQASDRSPTRMQVELDLQFLGDSVIRRAKRVDGVDTPVRDYEIAAARAHATALIERFATPRTPLPPRNTP
jgi:hypothetical protein